MVAADWRVEVVNFVRELKRVKRDVCCGATVAGRLQDDGRRGTEADA